jgi:hypothetical protein
MPINFCRPEREEILAKFAAVLSLTGEARKIVRR